MMITKMFSQYTIYHWIPKEKQKFVVLSINVNLKLLLQSSVF